ncbi:hypothetical protein REJC140_01518 [Pseudorhizobium endolithicum]|uniref:DUF2628 domain-containing protein n=1 Tax=Pseudorhizobium endolithicum TaxID=1191678 RepID=A0ABM8PUS2_9HYPH|nr:DUF2628 domain-containing protein [Pseudorhizobium endolithicum]CAD7049531.1 hypothetical protein REJC140_01518 [Pseudorhizobium endolithicum]
MKSYLVLAPPKGADPDPAKAIILADRFSWLALFFPWIWLLTKRLWLAAVAVFLAQIAAVQLTQITGFEVAGILLGFAINLLVALEGRHFYSESLIRRGWTLEDVVTAADLDTAEQIYFAGLPQASTAPIAAANWTNSVRPPSAAGWDRGGIGLFDQGGR